MVKLQILKIENGEYTLVDEISKQSYIFNIVFYGLTSLPEVGDTLIVHNELLNPSYEEYSTSYQFGPLDEVYGREITSSKDVDCITIFSKDKKTYLKRFFG